MEDVKLTEVVGAYRASRDYQALAPATRLNTDKALAKVGQFLDRPIRRLTRGVLMKLMDDMPSGSAYVFGTRMRALMKFAVDREYIEANPLAGTTMPTTGTIRPWTPNEMAAMTDKHEVHEQVRVAVVLAYYTGQRIGDVLRMKWSDITPQDAIYVRQRKTNVELYIPIHPALSGVLDTHPRLGDTIIADSHGQPYALNSFRRKFARTRDRLSLPKDLCFHGIRKTVACALAANGATTEQIKAVGGWKTTKQVDGYTQGADQFALAKGAMARLL